MRGSSPFSTYEEFYEATGPIYTFADRPAIIGILFVVSVLIFLYFIYATFTTKKGHSDAKSPVILGLLAATSVASAADALYMTYFQRNEAPQASRITQAIDRSAQSNRQGPIQSLIGLGMVVIGGSQGTRRHSSRRTRKASSRAKALRRYRRDR
jgi:hypothetical protein